MVASIETARPPEPLLASHLLGDEELDGLLEAVSITKRREKKVVLGTGVKSLDDALAGGLEGGAVVGVSGEAGGGGSEICQTLLVNSLLQYDGSTAAVIDTTGNFDVLKLYTRIVAQLQRSPEILASIRLVSSSEFGYKVEDVAAKVLDRVKIMRVFDFVGVTEAVGEIRDELEGQRAVNHEKEEWKESVVVEQGWPATPLPPRRTVVADSEDEDEDDEMLFDAEATITTPAPPVQEPEPAPTQRPHPKSEKQYQEIQTSGKVKFILIDTLAQVLNPLLKKDYIQANTLASTLLTTVSHLTRTRTLHTILFNPAITPRAFSPVRHAPNQPAPPPQKQRQEPPPPPSVFTSSTAVPSLMSVLGRYTDVEVLFIRVPRRKVDATVFYADNASGKGGGKKKYVEMVGVLEVVADRWEGRVGGWGTFMEGEGRIREVK